MTSRIRALAVGVIVTGICLMFAPGSSRAAPDWPGGGTYRVAPAGTRPPASPDGPDRLALQCPRAYTGIKGDLLPTDWTATDLGLPVAFVKSQVQQEELFCVYRLPTAGRASHASIRRRAPAGYRCETDGSGHFECRRARR